MTSEGWVKNYRKIAEWEWYTTPNMAHLFQHLIRSANHQDARWHGVEVKKGQVVVGLPSLSSSTGISIRGIRTCLERLEKSGEIVKKSTNKFTMLTICKYIDYQQEEDYKRQANDKQTTNKRQANDNKQEEEECKEGKEIKDKKQKFDPISFRPSFISEKSWADLVEHRKAKKAAQTERAYSSVVAEIEKAIGMGFTADDCIDKICSRNWTGFEAAWMANNTAVKTVEKKMSLKEQHALELLGNMQ